MKTSTCMVTSTDGSCVWAREIGSAITTSSGRIKPWVTRRLPKCIALLNRTGLAPQVGLEVRPPLAVEENHPKKREGESGAPASFLLSKYFGKQKNDGQPNRPPAPKNRCLFSAARGSQMGTSSLHRVVIASEGHMFQTTKHLTREGSPERQRPYGGIAHRTLSRSLVLSETIFRFCTKLR